MKKVLGVLALVLSVSSLALADQDQDTLKEIHFSTEFRQSYTDKKANTGNGLGIAGFKGENKEKARWRNIFGGDLHLVDEGNMGLRFEFQNDQDRSKNPFYYQSNKNKSGLFPITKGISDKSQTWETDIALYRDITLGSWTSKWELGWAYKATNGVGQYSGHRGTSNEIYVGPTFAINFFGQEFSAKTQAVYFDQSGGKSADNVWEGNDFQKGKVSGWGLNVALENGGKIFDNGIGSLDYNVGLTHKLRDAKGKLVATGKDAKSNVYLDYVVGTTYKTPSFGGFYGLINAENEWEKHTSRHGFSNNFSVWTGLGYKTGIDLPVGTLTLNPMVKYRVVNKETVKGYANDGRYTSSDKYTREYNELRAGLKVGLEVK